MAEKAKASGKKAAVKSPAKKEVTTKKAATPKKAAPVAKSTTAAATKPAATAAKRSSKPTKAGGSVSPEQRWRMIAEAAYYRAEQSNFVGDSVAEWLAAEREIDAKLGG